VVLSHKAGRNELPSPLATGQSFPNSESQERASRTTIIYHNLTKGAIQIPESLKDVLTSVLQVPLVNVSYTSFLSFASNSNDGDRSPMTCTPRRGHADEMRVFERHAYEMRACERHAMRDTPMRGTSIRHMRYMPPINTCPRGISAEIPLGKRFGLWGAP
jgi:hypothetical protein